MKPRLKLLIYLLSLVLLYAIYYWVVPIALNSQLNATSIQNLAKKNWKIDLEIQNPKFKMGLTPSVWIDAESFKVLDKNNSTPLSVKNPKLKIKLLPLIFGKTQLGYFSCDEITAKLKIDKDSKLYLGNYLILTSTNPTLSIENSRMEVGQYRFELNDELENKNILLDGNYFNLEKYNSKKQIKFAMNAKLKANKHTSIIDTEVNCKLPFEKSFDTNELLFDGTITNLNLEDFSTYIKKLSKNKIKKTSGIINIQADTKSLNHWTNRITTQMAIENLSILTKDELIFFNHKFNISSIIEVSKNKLNIKKLQILSKNTNSNISGKISKISSKNPTLDLAIIIGKSRIEDFLALIPTTKIKNENINLYALKKYGYYSDIQGKIIVKGKSDKPNILGEFISSNGYLIRPLNIPKVTIKLNFLGEKVYMDVNVPTGKSQKFMVKGMTELYGEKKSTLDITSTDNIDLEITQAILNPAQEILYLTLGPLPIMKLKGQGNISLKTKGTKTKPHLFGSLNFKKATASFNGINMQVKNIDGSLYFEDLDTHLITKKAFLDGKPIKVDGKCSLLGVLDYAITANGQDLGYLIKMLKSSPMLGDFQKLFPQIEKAEGKANITLKLAGKVKSIEEFAVGKTVFISGNINMLGNNILIKNLQEQIKGLHGNIKFDTSGSEIDLYSIADGAKIYIKGKIKDNNTDFEITGNIKNSPFVLNGNIKNLFQKNQLINAKFVSDNFDISALKKLIKYPFVKNDAQKYIDKISNPSGRINLRATVKNNVLSSKIKLNNLNFSYSDIPLKVFSGIIELKDDKLTLYKINALIDSMPILVDGFITDLFKNPNVNLYVNSKPTQNFIEKYINKKAIYPLKIKGDIIYSARIRGTKDLFSAKTEINLQEDSSIYYMGSTIGDPNDPIRIFLDTNVSDNTIYVSNFQYDKLITSQNNKEFISTQLNARGYINLDKNNINLRNFTIKTQNPTDAKVFNILFKKMMIKQGLFTSNLVINGPIIEPKLLGDLNFTGVDIPVLDTTVKDISLSFNEKNIELKATGEVFSNKITASSTMQNKLTPPYLVENIDLYFETLDINDVLKSLNNIQIKNDMNTLSEQKQEFNLKDLIIKNAKLKADNVFVKNIFAKNLLAELSLSGKMILSLDDFQFNFAEGKVNGNLDYNLVNADTNLDLHVDNVNANAMAEALFDLQNQIFGSLTGKVNLSCNGRSHKQCMETLSGSAGFRVSEGRMPKLGSLEYLLKAANLVKSGITGISINSLINLVTPLKTGQFDTINGDFSIKSGVADSIRIFSKGKDLSVFLTGKYNFSTLIADMTVFGKISKKMYTALGPIGNASLNTLFNTIPGFDLEETEKAQIITQINKIPGLELNENLYRVFTAEIYGDINGENYVQSFKWVE